MSSEAAAIFCTAFWLSGIVGGDACRMGEGDRFLGCFGGVRSSANALALSLWDGRERSLFEVFWWGSDRSFSEFII